MSGDDHTFEPAKLKEQLRELRRQRDEAQQREVDLEEKITALSDANVKAVQLLMKAEEQKDTLESENERLRHELTAEMQSEVEQRTTELQRELERYKEQEQEYERHKKSLAEANVTAATLVLEIEEKNEQLAELNEALERKQREVAVAYAGLEATYENLKEEQAVSQVEKRRLELELATAQAVQNMLLPDLELTTVPGVEIAANYKTASETGGDWLGYSFDRTSNQVSLWLGDVTGHGIASALITAGVFSYFSTVDVIRDQCGKKCKGTPEGAALDICLNPINTLRMLNRVVQLMAKGKMYMSFIASLLDLDSGILAFANAGHISPIYIADQETEQSSRLPRMAPGSMLGEKTDVDDATFRIGSMKLAPGDMLFFYTDGMVENPNREGKTLRITRVKEWLENHRQMPAGWIKNRVDDIVTSFIGDNPLTDDITFIVLKYTGRVGQAGRLTV